MQTDADIAVVERDAVHLDMDVFDALSPLHIRLDPEGRIVGVGRTLRLLFGDSDIIGMAFAECFQVVTPHNVELLEAAWNCDTAIRVILRTRPPAESSLPKCKLSGAAFRCRDRNGALVGTALMLTPGSEVPVLIERFNLKRNDLPLVDASPDVLFLVETQKQLLQDAFQMSERVETARREAERLSRSDVLTSLLNRLGLEQQMKKTLATKGRSFSMFHIDLDGFKEVNASFGHSAGDAVLKHVADTLKRELGPDDFAARFGGDEFVLVIMGCDEKAARSRASQILDAIAAPVLWNGHALQINCCIGLFAIGAEEEIDMETVEHRANLALYEAKNSGRNTWAAFDPGWLEFESQRRKVAAEIPEALEAGAFIPVYQPQVNARTGAVVGVEVLARWLHPDRGVLGPAYFSEAANASQTWTRIDARVRRSALDDISRFEALDLPIPTYSLNLDAGFLGDREASRDFMWAAASVGVPLEKVTFEIHESVLLDGLSAHLSKPAIELVERGFRLSLDDFGTGHASLASLIDLPFAELKIDRSFVQGIANSKRLLTLTETMVRMGQGLGLMVLAEGVETEEDCEALMAIGVDVMQGYLFARPMVARELENWMASRAAAPVSVRPAV